MIRPLNPGLNVEILQRLAAIRQEYFLMCADKIKPTKSVSGTFHQGSIRQCCNVGEPEFISRLGLFGPGPQVLIFAVLKNFLA